MSQRMREGGGAFHAQRKVRLDRFAMVSDMVRDTSVTDIAEGLTESSPDAISNVL